MAPILIQYSALTRGSSGKSQSIGHSSSNSNFLNTRQILHGTIETKLQNQHNCRVWSVSRLITPKNIPSAPHPRHLTRNPPLRRRGKCEKPNYRRIKYSDEMMEPPDWGLNVARNQGNDSPCQGRNIKPKFSPIAGSSQATNFNFMVQHRIWIFSDVVGSMWSFLGVSGSRAGLGDSML